MKKVILDLAVSLDGFIEGANGETDWCIMDDDMNFDRFLDTIDTIFYGRVSYDAWGNYVAAADAAPAEQRLWQAVHSKRKVVFSHQAINDTRITFINGNIAEQVNKIKQEAGKDIWLYGGAGLIKTFIQLNLIDEYRISLHPVVLGSGKPLFEGIQQRLNLKLIDSKAFRSGVVQLVYQSVMLKQ